MKLKVLTSVTAMFRSRPARGAWVEIKIDKKMSPTKNVAPRKGRVG